jgi:hypothetical protein
MAPVEIALPFFEITIGLTLFFYVYATCAYVFR